MKNIGIIGAGSLGTHLSKLICRNQWGHYLTMSDKNSDNLNNNDIWIGDNEETIQMSDVLFLTVKPYNIKSVCEEIDKYSNNWTGQNKKTIVSAAAGVPIKKIREWVGEDYNIVRCMPNIPISNGNGAILWYTDDIIHEEKPILDLVTTGPSSVWVNNEDLLDAATVSFGCAPAYIAKFFQTYVNIGEEMGFNKEETEMLLRDTFNGTLELLDDFDSDSIIEQVASKGGATERGLEKLDSDGFTEMIRESSFSSLRRIKNITKSLD